jgi:alkylation response protein AidB-like acyl-CoA dehydrogenase
MQPMPLGMELSQGEADLAAQAADLAASLGAIAPVADTSDNLHPEVVASIRKSGLFEHFVPAEFGGKGLSVFSIALIRERLAYQCVASDEFFASQGIPVQPIALFGTDEQKRRYLTALLDGSRLFAFCMTEPLAGSDILGIRATASPVEGGYALAGTKRYVFAGDRVPVRPAGIGYYRLGNAVARARSRVGDDLRLHGRRRRPAR